MPFINKSFSLPGVPLGKEKTILIQQQYDTIVLGLHKILNHNILNRIWMLYSTMKVWKRQSSRITIPWNTIIGAFHNDVCDIQSKFFLSCVEWKYCTAMLFTKIYVHCKISIYVSNPKSSRINSSIQKATGDVRDTERVLGPIFWNFCWDSCDF